MKHPVDMDYFLHGNKNTVPSSLQSLIDLTSHQNSHPPSSPKKSQKQHILIPNSSAVCSGCIQWNLNLSFFKGMEKTNDQSGKLLFLTKKVVHCLLLLGGILPQLKI
jgi:hypothetical protein